MSLLMYMMTQGQRAGHVHVAHCSAICKMSVYKHFIACLTQNGKHKQLAACLQAADIHSSTPVSKPIISSVYGSLANSV